jgi:hypothetical protein
MQNAINYLLIKEDHIMKTVFFCFLCMTGLLLTGCFDEVFNCKEGNGNIVTRDLDVKGFDGVKLRISADVTITQGEEFRVEVEGEENIIRELELDVRKGVWDIEFDRCVRRHRQLDIFITMPDIRELGISGSGSITGTNVITFQDIDLSISGSGRMDLALDGRSVDSYISGSGNMYLEGIIDDFDHNTSGSGDVKAFDLETRKADINISGSGDVEITVTEYLDVKISGSGDVFYRGNPEVDAKISGSGRVVQDL